MNEFDILSGFSNIDVLKNAPEQKKKKDYKDPRFWKISKDAHGDGRAVIRLLPDKNKIPFVRLYQYSSTRALGEKKFHLIVNSPDSIGLPCPIKEHYFELFNQGLKDEAKMFARKVKYYTNIYVEKDPANPENEGKVFLWEFGQKLLDKFTNWMVGDPEMGEQGKELFNLLSGHSIKLVINKNNNSGFFEYDRTDIMSNPTPVGNIKDKNKLVDVLNQTYDLNEFKSPEYFESYEEIKNRLNYFMDPFNKDSDKKSDSLTIEDDYVPPLKETKKSSTKQKQEDNEMPEWVSGGSVDTSKEEPIFEKKEKGTKKEEGTSQSDSDEETPERGEDWIQEFEDMFK